MPTATITIDNPTPKYGDMITLTATVEGTEGKKTGLRGVYTHANGQSFSGVDWKSETTYTDDVGLYAPNWPSGAAHAVVDVLMIVRTTKSGRTRTEVIGTLEFDIAA